VAARRAVIFSARNTNDVSRYERHEFHRMTAWARRAATPYR